MSAIGCSARAYLVGLGPHVLDVACGYGEFINNVAARSRTAVCDQIGMQQSLLRSPAGFARRWEVHRSGPKHQVCVPEILGLLRPLSATVASVIGSGPFVMRVPSEAQIAQFLPFTISDMRCSSSGTSQWRTRSRQFHSKHHLAIGSQSTREPDAQDHNQHQKRANLF